MIKKLLNKTINYIKSSYTPKIRKTLLGVCFFVFLSTLVITVFLGLKIDERIATREMEIKTQYQQSELNSKNQYEQILAKYKRCNEINYNKTVFSGQCILSFNEYAILKNGGNIMSMETKLSTDTELRQLKDLKSNLNSGLYWFIALCVFSSFVFLVPILQIIFSVLGFLIRNIFNNSKAIFISILKMSDYQRYSIIILILILVCMIVLVIF